MAPSPLTARHGRMAVVPRCPERPTPETLLALPLQLCPRVDDLRCDTSAHRSILTGAYSVRPPVSPEDILRQHLRSRIRSAPRPQSVNRSTPVLFFGDIFSARIATIGLNPSDQEFLDRRGAQLSGPARRFETLDSLGATDRRSLTREQCDQAIDTMRNYFTPGKPVYSWFRGLARVVEGMGARFQQGSAVHLDLAQEATDPTWSKLPDSERSALLGSDLTFLEWQLRNFPFETVVCTGKTVSSHVRARMRVEVIEQGEMARIKWWVGKAQLNGRTVGFCGWNFPLARPTGLGAVGETALGELLAAKLAL